MPKILVVDDEENNRDLLVRRLTRKAFEVILAVDGAEACARTKAERPDLVLMDIEMPVMNGYEATRHLKSIPETCTIPIIALTSFAMRGDCEKALDAGCDEYETKPVDFTRLLEKIQKLLQLKASS